MSLCILRHFKDFPQFSQDSIIRSYCNHHGTNDEVYPYKYVNGILFAYKLLANLSPTYLMIILDLFGFLMATIVRTGPN